MVIQTFASKKKQAKNGHKSRLDSSTKFKNKADWPTGIEAAYQRYTGPYTVNNAGALLAEEPLELFNGWLVWQAMTDAEERRVAANIQEILSLAARALGVGQAYPDQFECLMVNGDVHKPDVCIISRERYERQVQPVDPEGQHLVLKGSPELVIEIRSPSNRRAQERKKRKSYFESGALVIWDVDYKRRKIWVYDLENPDKGMEYTEKDLINCEQLLKGWQRRAGDFFARDLGVEEIVGQAVEQWRAEERNKTLREMLLRQSKLRFSNRNIPAELVARLENYSEAQLLGLLDNLMTVSSFEDWLELFPDPEQA